ncbi:phosphoribosylanthranilate isomerase [Hathewaya proteolytica DSM 3090]|uniref:N-(5'-phosphoribosyl)anthranilate isomerase n=1 Tax=Hathewaya proteolytica DSM 3090 TaxID=1121331 RepID=A0A1M6K6Q5_9CLOT|nr:phosphoribosylanthranilate isomerase [Hathewaya proteolytica]SHJ54656.1 phosphoribosylanthranilate isomerase [Hathewaya proteolytica DSM 3090]
MTKIKICGLKTMRDIDYINELMPDYVGLVFADSKRKVSLEQAITMRISIKNNIKVVGVFLDEDREKVLDTAKKLRLDVIQLHGEEDLEYMEYLKMKSEAEIWKAVCIKCQKDLEKIREYEGYKLLLDGASAGQGKCFDWSLVENKVCGNIILAGGINCNNVQHGIYMFKPFAVDVSSAVETEGIKDYIKMKEFIGKVRQYDKR